METQTTVLNVVTWVKNQKKSREEIQKINVPHHQQQNQQRQHIQHVFFYVNTTLVKINHDF